MSTTGRIDSLGARGEGVLRHEDRVVFIPGALPGELVRYEIADLGKRFDVGDLLEVLEPSPERRDFRHLAPPGPAFVIPATPSAVAEWKTALLRHRIVGAGHAEALVAPPLFVNKTEGSRNFMRYATLKKGRVGYRKTRREPGRPVQNDPVAHPLIEELRLALDGRLSGLDSVALRAGTRTGEQLAVIEGDVLPAKLDPVAFPGSLVGLDDQGYLPIKGLPWIHEEVLGVRLRVGAPTWFPICTEGADLLMTTLRSLAPESHVVWDLAAGCGLVSLAAFPTSEKIFAAEVEPYSLDDLRENVGETHRVSVRKQRPDDLVRDQNAVRERANTIVAWRRTGRLTDETRKELLLARADRVILVGDDTPGLIEDLRALEDSWVLDHLIPVDAVPSGTQLYHLARLRPRQMRG